MSLFRKVIVSAVLLVARNTYAADYSLDASTMAVGATAGENLIVKEGCLDPTKTTCAATEKVKWLVAPLTKVGSLEVLGNLSCSFEISVTADFDWANKGIVLMNSDNKGVQYSAANLDNTVTCGAYSGFYPSGIGTGGGKSGCFAPGWISGSAFNNLTITVQNGIAKVHINGQQNGADIIFDLAA